MIRLTTERLDIRPFDLKDIDELYNIVQDASVARYLPGIYTDSKNQLARNLSIYMKADFKDDAYFYKYNEQSRINEVLYEIRETVNRNFRGLPFVTDISYYLKRNENSYDYVATITYKTAESKVENETLVLE